MKTWISIALLALASFIHKGDAAISAWTTPSIGSISGAGTLSFPESTATGTAGVATTFAVTSAGSDAFTLLTTGTPFSVSSAGVLSLDTALDFETTTSYTIEVQAVDADPTTGTATITVSVTNANEAPAFGATAYGVNIADASAAGTTLTTVTATDPDAGDSVSAYSISAGNGAGHFSISSAGVITVATGQTLSASTTAAYALTVEAVDSNGTPLTGTTTIAVIVQSCSGSATLLASTVMILLMSFITLLK